MNHEPASPQAAGRVSFCNFLSDICQTSLIEEILRGLSSPPRHIPSMYFYDATGSKLFEKITRLREYYQSRTEMQLLRTMAERLAGRLHDLDIVELGSGDCSKISILLDSIGPQRLRSVRYVPLDVSQQALRESAAILAARYGGLSVLCIVADFMRQLHLIPSGSRRLFCFFGGTVGNLTPSQRATLFSALSGQMRGDDLLLMGADLVKSRTILERAYNDRHAITARFNRNILAVVNAIAGTDFEPERFAHVAFFNERHNRIEMHLRALDEMQISSPHLSCPLRIARDESIHTENSYKFTVEQIVEELQARGLQTETVLTDHRNWFCLLQISKAGA